MAFSDTFIESATAILKTAYPALADYTFTGEYIWPDSDPLESPWIERVGIHGTVDLSPTMTVQYVIFEQKQIVLFRTIEIKDEIAAPIAFAYRDGPSNWTGEQDTNRKVASVA